MGEKGRYIYDYPRPMVTVDAVIFAIDHEKTGREQTKVLLIQRAHQPFQGMWALPGGFVEIDEELRDAAERELFEETGLTNVELTELGVFGKIGRDPRGRTITIAYQGIISITEGKKAKAADDAARAEWFHIDRLPKLAFDHNEIIQKAVSAANQREDQDK